MNWDISHIPDSSSSRDKMVHAASAQESVWMNEFLASGAPQKGSSTMQTFSSGSLDSMDIPQGWKKGNNSAMPGGNTYDEFLPPGARDSSCRLQFVGNGTYLPEREAENFKSVLFSEDHQLTKEELDSLGYVLDNKTPEHGFRIDKGWTETVNGKRVLMVEGEFLKERRRNLSMIIDRDGTGSNLQEVTFTAPANKYDAQKNEVNKSMKTIKWK